MATAIDVKNRLKGITETVVQTFKDKKKDDKYDPTAFAKAMVKEAYEIGLGVSSGKLPAPAEEEVTTKKAKAK